MEATAAPTWYQATVTGELTGNQWHMVWFQPGRAVYVRRAVAHKGRGERFLVFDGNPRHGAWDLSVPECQRCLRIDRDANGKPVPAPAVTGRWLDNQYRASLQQ